MISTDSETFKTDDQGRTWRHGTRNMLRRGSGALAVDNRDSEGIYSEYKEEWRRLKEDELGSFSSERLLSQEYTGAQYEFVKRVSGEHFEDYYGLKVGDPVPASFEFHCVVDPMDFTVVLLRKLPSDWKYVEFYYLKNTDNERRVRYENIVIGQVYPEFRDIKRFWPGRGLRSMEDVSKSPTGRYFQCTGQVSAREYEQYSCSGTVSFVYPIKDGTLDLGKNPRETPDKVFRFSPALADGLTYKQCLALYERRQRDEKVDMTPDQLSAAKLMWSALLQRTYSSTQR